METKSLRLRQGRHSTVVIKASLSFFFFTTSYRYLFLSASLKNNFDFFLFLFHSCSVFSISEESILLSHTSCISL